MERIEVHTQEAAMRIIDKSGPLFSPADRDHCLQYIVSVGLLAGELTDQHYDDAFATDPRIDQLRSLIRVKEDPSYSVAYLDPAQRSIANSMQVFFTDGSCTEQVEVQYPIGHPRRRAEAIPRLRHKLIANLSTVFDNDRVSRIASWFDDGRQLAEVPVSEFLEELVIGD